MEINKDLQSVKFISKEPLPKNFIFKYTPDNLVQEGDLVVFWESADNFT